MKFSFTHLGVKDGLKFILQTILYERVKWWNLQGFITQQPSFIFLNVSCFVALLLVPYHYADPDHEVEGSLPNLYWEDEKLKVEKIL